MAMMYALINKDTLVQICNRKKVSTQYLADKGKFKADRLNRWLDTSDALLPTIKQAKAIAAYLHVPFAGLYMNPEDVALKKLPAFKNMRTIWGGGSDDDSALNIAMIDLLAERDFLISANTELGITMPVFSMSAPSSNDPVCWANEIRRKFSLSLEKQYKSTSPRQFYLYLRDQVETQGVFVHCFTDVPVETARGFAICDESMPIIGINDDDRAPAKSFSIVHELVHIIKRESSLCNDMSTRASQQEEVFCNAVAGELLVPQRALRIVLESANYHSPYSVDDIAGIAKKFSVSREVIIRRLLDSGRIDEVEYHTYAEEFQREIEQAREELREARQNGIKVPISRSISREAVDRTSSAVCKTLYQGFSEEKYSKRDIANHLNIDQKHIDKFLMEVSRWNN